jgi:hypothetical protein
MRQRIAKLLIRLPFFGKRYMKAMLKTIDRTPAGKLPPELRQMKSMLAQVPPAKRLELIQAAAKGELPKPEEMSREMRRKAERQARRKR